MSPLERQRPQSRAEMELIAELTAAIRGSDCERPRVLNVGAGRSTVIEDALADAGVEFICDRADITECLAVHPNVGECWTCAAESMEPVPTGAYSAVFANFALEHVRKLPAAAGEICRVLSPGGRLVATAPNTAAPEFLIARYGPRWLRNAITGTCTYPTYYSYSSICQLLGILASAGLRTLRVRYSCCVADYLSWVPLVSLAARLYDRAVARFQAVRLMGHACIVMERAA